MSSPAPSLLARLELEHKAAASSEGEVRSRSSHELVASAPLHLAG